MFQRHRLENITLDLNSKENNRFVKDAQITCNTRNLAGCIQYDEDDEDDEIYNNLILILWKHQLSIE